MQLREKNLLKNIGILTISNFASKIMVFLLVPLITRILSKEEYGSYDIVYSSIQLLFPILSLNVSEATMRFSMDKEKNTNDVIAVGIKILLIGILPIGVFFLSCNIWNWIPIIYGYEFIILIYIIFYFSNQFLIQLAKGLERIKDMGVAGVMSSCILLGGSFLFLVKLKLGLKGFYYVNALSQIVPTVYLLIRIKIWKYKIFKAIDNKLIKEMLLYCTPLIVTVLGWWVNNTADKYVVTVICGTAANGLLSVAYKIPSIINIIQSIFNQAWQVTAIKEYSSKDKASFYGYFFSSLNFVMAISCSVLILLSKPIGKIMYAGDFYEAWQFVPFLIISNVINTSSGFLGPILTAKKESKPMALSAIYGSIINVGLNILLVKIIGIQGATLSTAISSLVIYLIRKRAVGLDIKVDEYGAIILTWIVLSVQAMTEICTLYWWVEIILIIIIIFINRNIIKKNIERIISIRV